MVSIIVPIYNCASFLDRCLSSIQNQTYTDLEIICVDDGSIDTSGDVINKYVMQDARFKYLSKEHSNAGETRNFGMRASSGDYLLFLDGDDFFSIDLVAEALKCAISTDADITVFQYKLYDEKKRQISKETYGIHTNRKKCFSFAYKQKGIFDFTNVAVWNKLYKADFIKKKNLTFTSHSALNDLFFSWCSLIFAERIALCRHVGTFYRVNSGKSISDNLVDTSECFIEVFEEFNDYIKTIGMWDQLKNEIKKTERKHFDEFYSRVCRDNNLGYIASTLKKRMERFFD